MSKSPDTDISEVRERMTLLATSCDVSGLDHLPVVSRENAAPFAADLRALLSDHAGLVAEKGQGWCNEASPCLEYRELLAEVERLKADNSELRRKALPVGGTDTGERRQAATKLLCDICACAAEAEPESLALPHVVEGCLLPLGTLIAERDACLYLLQQAHRHHGRDVIDAIVEKAAAERRAEAAESALAASKAREETLVEGLNLCMTGGNHIAGLLIEHVGPGFADRLPPDTDPEIALRQLHATDNYELWCCWAAIMRARALSSPQEGEQ